MVQALSADGQTTVESGLRELDHVCANLAAIDPQLAPIALARSAVQRLMMIPGVDVAVAWASSRRSAHHPLCSPQKLVIYLSLDSGVRLAERILLNPRGEQQELQRRRTVMRSYAERRRAGSPPALVS